ncbi:phosphoglycerate kinase [Candidatus Roizmanbacteria bacterium]|nr:phosphoglycerate kinase [Candidatus Roizmanbacteria bacterium]
MTEPHITYIDETDIKNKRVLLRVDFNVSLNPDFSIADDARIRQSLPTLLYLLTRHNKLILLSHLGRPKQRDKQYSLKKVADKLQEYLPKNKVTLVDDFLEKNNAGIFAGQSDSEVIMLENTRFYPGEKKNDPGFAKQLSRLADVYVNDAFAVAHREEASVVGVTKYLPSYGGLLLKREVEMISKAIRNPKKPLVAIIGGAKISTKIGLLDKLSKMAEYVLVGGGLANTFLKAKGYDIGSSYCEDGQVETAKYLIQKTNIVLPQDVVVGNKDRGTNGEEVTKLTAVPPGKEILDIGPETQALFGSYIAKAKTIIWNGPVGYIENPAFRRGTDFIFYSLTANSAAVSIVGGGDTLAAISKKEYLEKITHISTGGGAMLEFIEKGTLPGIEALRPLPPA